MSLKRGIFYTFLTQAPTLLLLFISSTVMTRLLGEEGRGAYALLYNQMVLITAVLGLSLGFAITYFVSKDQGDPRQMVRVSASLLIMNLVLVPLLLAVIFYTPALHRVFLPYQASNWGYQAYLFIAVILSQVNGFIGSLMLALKKFAIVNRMSIVSACLTALGFTALYFWKDVPSSFSMLSLTLALSVAILGVISILWIGTYVRIVGILPVPIWDWMVLKPVVSFVLVAHLSNIVNMINYRFDVWVVSSYAGTAQLGLYAVAVGMAQFLFYIPEPFSRVLQPHLYGEMSNELMAKFKFVVRLNFTTVALLSLILALAAPWFVPLLFGRGFAASVPALWWLLPGIIFASAAKLLAPLIVQAGLIRFNLYATAVAAGFTVILDLLLIPQWGIVGASVASSISYLSLLIFCCGVIVFKMNITVGDMFVLKVSDMLRLRDLVKSRLPNLANK